MVWQGKYLSYEKDGQTIEISPNQDGSYLIPEGVDPATVRFYIWDKAYNTNTLTLDGQNAYKSAEKESGKSRGKRSSEDGQKQKQQMEDWRSVSLMKREIQHLNILR